MKKYVITAAAILCGITFASCSNDSDSSDSSESKDNTTYTSTDYTLLNRISTNIYKLQPGTDNKFSTNIEYIISKDYYNESNVLKSHMSVSTTTENGVTTSVYYLFNGSDESTAKVLTKGLYKKDTSSKVKTLYEWNFGDSGVDKATAEATVTNTSDAALAYYESYADDAFTKSLVKCVYMPNSSTANEVDTYEVTTYVNTTDATSGDTLLETSASYFPINLKWDETTHTAVAADSSKVSDGKMTFTNYNGTTTKALSFPVADQFNYTYKKAGSTNEYDYELTVNNLLQRVTNASTGTTDYQYNGTYNYRYDFMWANHFKERPIEQICWILNDGDDITAIKDNISSRSSTLVVNVKPLSNGTLVAVRESWLNPQMKTQYYRTYEFEPVTVPSADKTTKSDSTTDYYNYLYKYYASDDTSNYPTHISLAQESHQDCHIPDTTDTGCYYTYTKSAYSNESSVSSSDNSGVDTVTTSSSVNRSIAASSEYNSPFYSLLPEAKIGRVVKF